MPDSERDQTGTTRDQAIEQAWDEYRDGPEYQPTYRHDVSPVFEAGYRAGLLRGAGDTGDEADCDGRIQRKRTKGWRMPEGAIYVGRPTQFGNPFRAYKCPCCGYWDVRDENDVTYLVNHEYTRQAHVRADRRTWTTRSEAVREAVRLYGDEATYWLGGWETTWPNKYAALPSLRGHDLACWCPLDEPCHADVLLELANGGQS